LRYHRARLSPCLNLKMIDLQQLPGLYIHIPFCKTKCPYCDFYSETSTSLIPEWLRSVKKEALLYRDRFISFDTLYLGGGTPTVLDEPALAALVEHLFKAFRFAPDAEITIEANPNDITPEKLRALRAAGVNRISLGVQSFDEQDVSVLRRRHSVRESVDALTLIRSCGFTSTSIDLIYGIPGQTMAAWLATLQKAVSFQPEHISCYQLTMAEGTLFGQMHGDGQLQLPGEKESETLFLTTARFLEENGYLQYEISNFARGEEHCSRHNRKYWQHAAYLGLGPSAHSFQEAKRWWNVRSIKKYCASIEEGRVPVAGAEVLTEEQLALESLYLGLRTRDGIDLSKVGNCQITDTVLPQLLKEDYVKITGSRVVPTKKGFLVADRLPLLFV
jgi:putative oxygen-independent coproporphyrinogen III oxidase